MGTVHTRSYQYAFSLNKQADILTPIADGNINKLRSIRTFAPIQEIEPAKVSDMAWFGKGHPHPTFADRIQKRYELPAQERSATSVELLQALAFVLGKVVSTQPGTGSSPNEWQHVITWQDLATNKEVLYTTVIEKMGSEYQKRLAGAWLDSVTIRGNRDDHVVMSYTGGGRKYEDSVASMPSLTAASFFKTLYGRLKFGLTGATADISTEVLSFEFTFNQNPQPYHLMGNASGEEQLVTQVLIGNQVTTGSAVIRISATHRSRYLLQQSCGFEVMLKSPDIIDNQQHSCKLEFFNCILSNETFGQDGDTVSYTLQLNEGNILRAGLGDPDPVKATIISNISNTALLVTA